jgi:WD40 repeat protein
MIADLTVSHSSATPESPWLGLRPFTEDARAFFFGRSAELEDLYERVVDRPLTTLYGQSGLGKSSLLQAALVPRLRANGLLPVPIRFDHDPAAPPLERQLLDSLRAALVAGGDNERASAVEAACAAAADGLDWPARLWLVFHDPSRRLIPSPGESAEGFPRPVFLIDQFEEVFTLGERAERRCASAAFRDSLAALVENSPPMGLRSRIEVDRDLARRLDYRVRRERVLLALREDFLHVLERWKRAMPSLMENRLELRMLSGPQAFQAVVRPGELRPGMPPIIPDDVGRAIVRFVAGVGRDVPLEEIVAVPPLLSLVCAELNAQRLAASAAQITQDPFAGQGVDILKSFYLRSFAVATYGEALAGLPDAAAALGGVRRLVEERLLSPDGFRESIALDTIVRDLGAEVIPDAAKLVLDRLVERRLLVIEERGGVRRVELTHDVLTGVVKPCRDERHEREVLARSRAEIARAEAETARIRRERNRLRQWVALAAGLAALALAGFIVSGIAFYRARKNAAIAKAGHYTADMLLAQQAALEGNIARATGLLDRYRDADFDDFHGFEWRYLWWLCDGDSQATYRGFKNQTWAVAFAPDGTALAAAGLDAVVRVFDMATHRLLDELPLKEPGVLSIAFSPDGLTLACATGNWELLKQQGKVYFRDWRHHRNLYTLDAHDASVNKVFYSRDGKYLGTCGEDNSVALWKIAGSGSPSPLHRFTGASAGVNDATFSPDGQWLAAGSGDGHFQVWEIATKKLLADYMVHVSGIMSLAFVPDGKTLLLGTHDGPILRWDTAARRVVDKIDSGQGAVNAIAFSKDGRQFASAGSDSTVAVWNLADRSNLIRLYGHRDRVLSVAFSPKDQTLASASGDGTVKLWNVARKRGVPALQYEAAVSSLAFSPDSRILAIAGGAVAEQVPRPAATQASRKPKSIWLWEIGDPGRRTILPGHGDIIRAIAFSSDGRTLASGCVDGTAALWDVESGHQKAVMPHRDDSVYAVRLSPDGSILATGSREGKVTLWDTRQPKQEPLAVLPDHRSAVRAVAFSPDGTLLASASADRTVRVWRISTRRCVGVLEGFKSACTSVEFTSDGRRMAAASIDRTVRLWDRAAGAGSVDPASLFIFQGYKSGIRTLAFSADNRILAAGTQDSSVILWSVSTTDEVAAFPAHYGGVACVAFAPNGAVLATGGNDQMVKLWLAPPRREPADADPGAPGWTTP